jgi:hypothetical protein
MKYKHYSIVFNLRANHQPVVTFLLRAKSCIVYSGMRIQQFGLEAKGQRLEEDIVPWLFAPGLPSLAWQSVRVRATSSWEEKWISHEAVLSEWI